MTRFAAGLILVAALGAVAPADDQGPGRLGGTYTVVGYAKGGKEAPAAALARMTATIAGGELTVVAGGKPFPSRIAVDPKRAPAHLDVSPSDGPHKGKTFPGIFKRENGRLILAYDERPGAVRPAGFAGDGVTVLTLVPVPGQ